jgi:hypothetical protein
MLMAQSLVNNFVLFIRKQSLDHVLFGSMVRYAPANGRMPGPKLSEVFLSSRFPMINRFFLAVGRKCTEPAFGGVPG